MSALLRVEEVELYAGDDFSPIQDQAVDCDTKTLALCCGRRVGKTWMGSRVVTCWMHQTMADLAEQVERGERGRWCGEGLRPTTAQTMRPDVLYMIVAPRDDHLQQIRGYLMEIYSRNGAAFNHPQFPDWFTGRNRHLWVWHEGVCGRYDFVPATNPSSLVSRGLHGAWVDEAGFIGNGLFQAFGPSLWEHGGRLLASGTPSLGTDHWFTRTAMSGLDPGHERYDAEVCKRDPRVTTIIASTTEHAFVKRAREEALHEAAFWGELWAAQWIYADWRQRTRQIFREWSTSTHVVGYRRGYGIPQSASFRSLQVGKTPWCYIGSEPVFEKPTSVYGVADWSGGADPGAAIVCLVWRQNPMNDGDPRPLVVVVEDYEGHDAYTSDGWWRILTSMSERWGVDKWIGDPHSPNLIRNARRAGIPMQEGAQQDKLGRISLISALIHHAESAPDEHGEVARILPALFVARTCEHTPREIDGFKWAVTRDGLTKNKPVDRHDHTVDCLAMLAAEVYTGSSIQIGHDLYR